MTLHRIFLVLMCLATSNLLGQTVQFVDDSPSGSPVSFHGTITFPANSDEATCEVTGHSDTEKGPGVGGFNSWPACAPNLTSGFALNQFLSKSASFVANSRLRPDLAPVAPHSTICSLCKRDSSTTSVFGARHMQETGSSQESSMRPKQEPSANAEAHSKTAFAGSTSFTANASSDALLILPVYL